MKAAGGVYQKIVGVDRQCPDDRHDTRHLECGHESVVARARLHPMTGRCKECEENFRLRGIIPF
jgi:hypothetical protein